MSKSFLPTKMAAGEMLEYTENRTSLLRVLESTKEALALT